MSNTRQAGIVNILLQKEIVRVKELTLLFQVSPITIRRDLIHLENIGMVKRYYGGAILDDSYSKKLNTHSTSNLIEQCEISKRAIALLKPQSIVAITPSKIHETLSSMLPKELDLTIITNSLSVFDLVKDKFDKVVLTGGFYMKSTNSFEGEEVKLAMERHDIDWSFIGFNGFKNNIIYTGTMMESIVKRSLIKNSKETIVLAEDYKINYTSNYNLCQYEDITHIIKFKS